MLLSAFLLFHLFGLAMQSLLAAGNLHEGPASAYPTFAPAWELKGFRDPRDFFYSNALTAMQWLFAMAGLWVRQPRPWLNWTWSVPWIATVLLEWLHGSWSFAALLDH